LGEVAENIPADVKRKAELYARVHASPEAHQAHRAANLWMAAFFAPLKQVDDPTVPTTERLWEYMERPNAAYASMIGMADSLAIRHSFFHWFLEFPEAFALGGFNVVLGKPSLGTPQTSGRGILRHSEPRHREGSQQSRASVTGRRLAANESGPGR
jgi:hypothetical protein